MSSRFGLMLILVHRCDRDTQAFSFLLPRGHDAWLEEFDTPFCPIEMTDATRILLRQVYKAFETSATSIGDEPGFFERMRTLSEPNRS
jgi:hypothetical protein